MYEIFVDVSIDIDEKIAEKYGIRYVPMEYMIGEETHCCTAPESFETLHEYYERLRGKIPTKTSQISPYQYVSIFEPYVKEKKELLYISLSSGLSNTYESANLAVEQLKDSYGEVHIEVVDSLGATGGMGLLAESACINRENGMSLSENAKWLREHAANVNFLFKVEDLMYLMRGGRISSSSAIMGTALNIKPILCINSVGKLETISKKRGKNMAMKYLVENMENHYDATIGNTVYICGADCMADAEMLKQMVLDKFPDTQIRITSLSPIIGAHTGPNMLALIYYGEKRA